MTGKSAEVSSSSSSSTFVLKAPQKKTWPTKAAANVISSAYTTPHTLCRVFGFLVPGWFAKRGPTKRVNCWPWRYAPRTAGEGVSRVTQIAKKPLAQKSPEPVCWTSQVLLLGQGTSTWLLGSDTPVLCHTLLSCHFVDVCDCCCSRSIQTVLFETFRLAQAIAPCRPTSSSPGSSQSEGGWLQHHLLPPKLKWTLKDFAFRLHPRSAGSWGSSSRKTSTYA